MKVKAADGYNVGVDLLCKIRDTGNGFIAKFPTYNSVNQEYYVCLSYSEAEYLYKGLKHFIKKWRSS